MEALVLAVVVVEAKLRWLWVDLLGLKRRAVDFLIKKVACSIIYKLFYLFLVQI